jgi:hypothetical protein
MTIDEKHLRELCAAATSAPWMNRIGIGACDYIAKAERSDDADFIAAARTAVPALLDEVAMLRQACVKWQEIFTGFPHDAQQALRDLKARNAELRAALLRACDAAEDMRDPKTDAELDVAYSEIAALREIGSK